MNLLTMTQKHTHSLLLCCLSPPYHPTYLPPPSPPAPALAAGGIAFCTRATLLSVGLAKTSLRQARSLKRKQSGGTD